MGSKQPMKEPKEPESNKLIEKQRLKFDRKKLFEFFKRQGFYIALFICVAAVGLTAIFSLTGGEAPKTTEVPGAPAEKIKSPTLEDEINNLYVPKASASAMPSPSVSPSPGASPGVSPKPQAPSIKLAFPVKGSIIRPFAINKLLYNKTLNQWATHNGADLKAAEGDTVKCAMAGAIDKIYQDPVLGGVIIIKSDSYTTLYAGVTADKNLAEGSKTTSGQALGVLKTPFFEGFLGPHLHFELMKGKEYLDPALYMK